MTEQTTKCIICGKDIPEYRLKQGKKTCCKHCQMLTPESKQKRSALMKKRYENIETKQKISESMKKRWQDETYANNVAKGLKKAMAKPEYHEKLSNSLKAYHSSDKHQEFIAAMNKPETKERISKAQKARFADEEKYKAFVKTMNRPEVKEKLRTTMMSFEIQNKINSTKKANGTLNTSKDEDLAYEMLYAIFPDTVRQYFSERYPFKCDFYIPSIDLFIEGHFGWLHGDAFFDKNNPKHLQQLEQDKANAQRLINERGEQTNMYTAKIYTWTNLDVRKKQWADNHPQLNLLFFFSLWEFEQWLKSIQ